MRHVLRCMTIDNALSKPLLLFRSFHCTMYCRSRPNDHRQFRLAGRAAAEAAAAAGAGAGAGASKGGKEEVLNKKNAAIGLRSQQRRRRGISEQQPVTGPTSPQAYLYRLHRGRFDDLAALLTMPYAVPPFRILTDVLREAMDLKARLVDEDFVKDSVFEKPSDALDALQRMLHALSDPLAVRHVLSKAICKVEEKAESVSAVGDRDSERDLHEELDEMRSFVEQLRKWNASAVANPKVICLQKYAGCQQPLVWTMPDAVMAEIWHILLELCSLTGAFDIAVESLNELIELSERVGRVTDKSKDNEIRADHEGDGRYWKDEGERDSREARHSQCKQLLTFTLDGVVEAVEEEARHTFNPVTALDHIRAIESCKLGRNFDIAYSLFRRYMQYAQSGMFPLTANDISAALVGLAHSCNNDAHFAMLQELFVESEASRVVEVSVKLYTAFIDAVSRTKENPKRMAVALALYRRLRDSNLSLTADTYAALIACCASMKEPTHAFAFYHEALQQCGADNFTPAMYTNLLLAYARAGYGSDARQMLEVLIEAGAPLIRSAFHAVLSCAVTVRDAEEVLELMQKKYMIAPTPQTYAYLVATASARPSGVSTVLRMFDWHELVMRSLLETDRSAAQLTQHGIPEGGSALSTSSVAVALEEELLERYPAYGEAVEGAFLRLRIDPARDPRLEPYLRPLLRVAQMRMNSFTGMAPQTPTRVPKGAAIAVLAADVLANIGDWFIPFVSHYSAVVIPSSSLLAFRHGGGQRTDTTFEKGSQHLLFNPLWCELGSEQQSMVEARRQILLGFLHKYRDAIHLVSIGEELALSCDCDRYGISVKKTFARCASLALNLARMDVKGSTKVYAEQKCNIVLVSTNFESCGRYVVDLKREILHGKRSISSGSEDALKDGLQRVWYHNPCTSPQWRPPQLSVASLVNGVTDQTSA